MALVAVLMVRVAPAQNAPVTTEGQFAGLHAGLVTAADRVLAEALSDRVWMKAGDETQQQTATQLLERVSAAVQRVQQLRPLVNPILHAEGVPPELIAVALVESGGQTMVTSPKGARGLWQFMPGTARRYGLEVSGERDERVELVKSTRAAARYLRDLHRRFGDWRLAFAAYNAGEQAVEQAMTRAGHRDFVAIRHFLPQETRNYVPAVWAAMQRFEGELAPSNQPENTGLRVVYASAEVRN
jgi:membrane-bound lytic murein transglycosylase MltF